LYTTLCKLFQDDQEGLKQSYWKRYMLVKDGLDAQNEQFHSEEHHVLKSFSKEDYLS